MCGAPDVYIVYVFDWRIGVNEYKTRLECVYIAYLEGVRRKLVRDHECREMEPFSSSLSSREEERSGAYSGGFSNY